ncbi:nanos homolog 1-like [Xenia sp. Carnegie-2017]|uniref:nanos homolog 1-like n=1 Tax=Xenia sp. Carnegie-2017 TaxID=2897299 RepID=UPI001F03314C|nr:nanos homolog 1-like [Xenia sp. Carnegie-2017]
MSLSELVLKTLMPSNFLDSDDDDTKSMTDNGTTFNKNEFNVFNDYFGLINLVQKCKHNAIPSNELGFFEANELTRYPRRDRFDSIDSENSSSGSCDSFSDLGLTIGESTGFQPFPSPSAFSCSAHTHRRRADSLTNLSRRGKGVTASSSLPRGFNPPSANLPQVCVFCRNNGEPEELYTSHVLKGPDGKTTCPILRAYTCPICKATGDDSHTIKYCPQNQQITQGFLNGPQVVGPRPKRTVGSRKTR